MKKFLALMLVLFATAAMAMSLSKLNTASKEELMQIKGIGEKKAEAILKARKKGKFTSYDDLMARVPGIGEQTAANIKGGVKNGEASKKVTKKSKKKAVKKRDKSKAKVAEKTSKKRVSEKKSKAEKAEKALKKKKKEQKKKSKSSKKKSKKAA